MYWARKKNQYLKMIVVILIIVICYPCCQPKNTWNGNISDKDGITYINNPADPVFKENSNDISIFENFRLGKENGDSTEIFAGVIDTAIDTMGNIYVLEQWHIKKYNSKGEYINTLGKPGAGPGELFGPHLLAINKKNQVFIYESKGKRVSIYNIDMKFVNLFNIIPNKVFGMIDDSMGNIYIGSYHDNKIIHKYSNQGELLTSFAENPYNNEETYALAVGGGKISINDKEEILLVEPNEYKIRIYDVLGKLKKVVNTESDLFYPPALKALDDQNIKLKYVAGVDILGFELTSNNHIVHQYYDRQNSNLIIDLFSPDGIFLGRLKTARKDISRLDYPGNLLTSDNDNILIFRRTGPFSNIRIIRINICKYEKEK